jgi:Bacterial Ig domain
MKKTLLFFSSIFLLLACTKDIVAPNFTLTSPSDKQAYKNGEIINIKGQATDDGHIHYILITITDQKTGKEVFIDPLHLHDAEFTLDRKYTISETANTTYLVDILVTDANDNEITKSLTLKIN